MPQPSIITTEDDDELTRELQEEVSGWSSNSNECFTVQLVRGDGTVVESFNPEFTYAMFGDEEVIFGYQGLSITLSFAAHDLKPRLEIDYDKIFETQGEVRPTDIREVLKEFLPASVINKKQKHGVNVADFTPPGERIHQYTRNGKSYGIWCASLSDPAAKRLLTNMQILIPMFIDGGSMLELDFDWTTQRWKAFFVYEVDSTANGGSNSPYTLIGYGTSYRIFSFPDRSNPDFGTAFSSQPLDQLIPTPESPPNQLALAPDILSPLDLPSRERLSQFLILPPFQGARHGQELYHTMYTHLTSAPNVREFTVEDPNEKFDELRDFCDLRHLRAHDPGFAALRVVTDLPESAAPTTDSAVSSANETNTDHALIPTDVIVPRADRERAQAAAKIMPRQFDRLVEMHTLSFIPPPHRQRARLARGAKASNPHDRAYFFWRLYVKHRLYLFNRDQLAQVERAERVEKLEAALDSVQQAYGEMIEKVEKREREDREREMVVGRGGVGTTGRKRKVVVEDEDEDGDGGEKGEGAATVEGAMNGSQKKAKVE